MFAHLHTHIKVSYFSSIFFKFINYTKTGNASTKEKLYKYENIFIERYSVMIFFNENIKLLR